MKILGDQQILLLHELFSQLGKVEAYSGREITPQQLQGVEALITRSTVVVDESLLAQSNVRFVGTCTIGTDHLDTHYLGQQNICWTNAAGCNADAVVQYVLSAMAQLAPAWRRSRVGIIACGNIGRRVYRRLTSLGVECVCYDPLFPKKPPDDPNEEGINLVSLDTVLACDIITSHAPLTKDGPYPTYHMLGTHELAMIRPDSLLISAGRGAVIDNQALLAHMQEGKTFKLVLDVWENEPDILTDLLPYTDIATPHIAGHSLEGKEQGTYMVYRSLCDYLDIPEDDLAKNTLNTERRRMPLHERKPPQVPDEDIFNQWLLAMYPIMDDDSRLRAWCQQAGPMSDYFDALRKHYPVRREYSHFMLPDWAVSSLLHHWMDALTA
jgi:erythronate-4-phosphate dehydrogenase